MIASNCQSQKGFTILEVLITIVIVAFGLLGLAGLQSKYLVAEMESYQRSQAIILVQDMISRIAANRLESFDKDQTFYITDAPISKCSNPLIQSARDLCAWGNELAGVAEQSGSSTKVNIGAMAGATGCVRRLSTNPMTYQVSVAWQGLTPTKAPVGTQGSKSLDCGSNAYGDENLRRIFALEVVIPILID